jgi:hypothetical protein
MLKRKSTKKSGENQSKKSKNTKSYQTQEFDSRQKIQNPKSQIEMAETTGFEPVKGF